MISHFGNVPVDSLIAAVEKTAATMDEGDLAVALDENLSAMPSDALRAFLEAVLDAFRDRGESSEDAAEASGITLERIDLFDPSAIGELVRYASRNTGLLREATALFVEEHPALIAALPRRLLDGVAQRLTASE